MRSTDGRERRSRLTSSHARKRSARPPRGHGRPWMSGSRWLAIALAATALGAAAPSTAAAEEIVTFPSSPLVVSVGRLGQCQSSYPNRGVNYYQGGANIGDCGFFLAFPAVPGQ